MHGGSQNYLYWIYMSLSKTTLSAIQQAGQALHKATVVVAGAVREQAEHMVATVASQPFQAEGEQAFANFKMLARLSQELLALEEQLKNLYATASDLASPVMDVVAALPRPNARVRAAAQAQNDVAEDAVVKPASVRSAKRVAKPAIVKSSTRKPAKAVTRTADKKSSAVPALTGNDSKVLDYLKTVLKPGEWVELTGAAVAKGAAMPLGSVGISIKKVVAFGAVKKRGRGSYQLAA
jgi:hypothetical protein